MANQYAKWREWKDKLSTKDKSSTTDNTSTKYKSSTTDNTVDEWKIHFDREMPWKINDDSLHGPTPPPIANPNGHLQSEFARMKHDNFILESRVASLESQINELFAHLKSNRKHKLDEAI